MKQLQIISLCAALMLSLSACLALSGKSTDENDFYSVYTTDTDVFIEIPALRQYVVYICGTT